MPDGHDYRQVLLIDRACTGGFEFQYDGEPIVWAPGEMEVSVSADVVRFVFTHDHLKVHTTDGQYVHRVAIKAAPGFKAMVPLLQHELGTEVADSEPIEIADALEGWDTRGVPRGLGITETKKVHIDAAALRERQGVGRQRAVAVEKS